MYNSTQSSLGHYTEGHNAHYPSTLPLPEMVTHKTRLEHPDQHHTRTVIGVPPPLPLLTEAIGDGG